jgi:hypothetical protein
MLALIICFVLALSLAPLLSLLFSSTTACEIWRGFPEERRASYSIILAQETGKKSRMGPRRGREGEFKLDKAEQPYYNGRRHPRRGCSAEGARFLRKE